MRRRIPTSLIHPGPRQQWARVALLCWVVLSLAGAAFFALEARQLDDGSLEAPAFHGVILILVMALGLTVTAYLVGGHMSDLTRDVGRLGLKDPGSGWSMTRACFPWSYLFLASITFGSAYAMSGIQLRAENPEHEDLVTGANLMAAGLALGALGGLLCLVVLKKLQRLLVERFDEVQQ